MVALGLSFRKWMYGLIEMTKHDAPVCNHIELYPPAANNCYRSSYTATQYWLSSQPALKPNRPGLDPRMIWVRAQVSLILEDLSSQGYILPVQDECVEVMTLSLIDRTNAHSFAKHRREVELPRHQGREVIAGSHHWIKCTNVARNSFDDESLSIGK